MQQNYKNQGNSRAALKRKKKERKPQKFQSTEENVAALSQSFVPTKSKRCSNGLDIGTSRTTNRNEQNTLHPSHNDPENVPVHNSTLHNITKLLDCINPSNPLSADYSELSSHLLSFLLNFESLDDFYRLHWSKSLYHTAAKKNPNRFSGVIDIGSCKDMVKSHVLYYNKDVLYSGNIHNKSSDITYHDNISNEDNFGGDESVEPEIEATSKDVWQQFSTGFSIRILRPQIYNDSLWALLSLLEIEFESIVSCIIQVMPPNGVGFGRQVASGDLLVMQIEGASIWSVWPVAVNSLSISDQMDNEGDGERSSNSSACEIHLAPGDVLYIPKRAQYQEGHTFVLSPSSISNTSYSTVTGEQLKQSVHHSLFLILKTNEVDSNHALLNLTVPMALQQSLAENVSTDKTSLPLRSFSYMGAAHSESDEDIRRDQYLSQLKAMLKNIANRALELTDAAADQLRKQFLIDRLPIPLSPLEERWTAVGCPHAHIMPYTVLRMVRPHAACAVVEDGSVVLYHCMDNSREIYGSVVSPLVFELDDGPAIEELISAHPNGVVVNELSHSSEELEDKLALAQALFKEGFLLIMDDATRSACGEGGRKGKRKDSVAEIGGKGENPVKHAAKISSDDDSSEDDYDDDDPF